MVSSGLMESGWVHMMVLIGCDPMFCSVSFFRMLSAVTMPRTVSFWMTGRW